MRLKPALSRLLLVLAFLGGQWLAVAHAAQHELLAKGPSCEVCAVAHCGAAPPAAPALPRLPDVPRLRVDAHVPGAPELPVFRAFRSRAPPHSLV